MASILLMAVGIGWFTFSSPPRGESEVVDVNAWADSWMQATRTRDYYGTVSIQGGNGTAHSFELWHQYRDGTETERLRRTNGPLLEIQRVDDDLTCVHGPDADIPQDHALPGSPFAQLMHLSPEQLAAQYTVTRLASTEHAGRASTAFVMQRREPPYGHQHTIWLDAETEILLGYAVHNEAGETLSQARFESIHIGEFSMPGSLRDQFTNSFWHRFQARPAASDDASELVWQTNWLPEGYSRSVSERRGEGWYQLWTDGLARVSVLVEPIASGTEGLDTTEQQGAESLVAQRHGDWQVVVIGTLPQEVTERIAREISWQHQ